MGGTAPQSAARIFGKHLPNRVAATACALLFSNVAAADALNLVAGGAASHDSNIFKQPVSITDTIRTGYVGLRVDKPYSLQRFQLELTATSYRYSEQSYLDYDAVDYRAAWLWSATPSVTGSVKSERTERQVPFFDVNSVQRNVRVSTRNSFDLDGAIGSALHVIFGLYEAKQVSAEPFLAQPDYRQYGGELGLRYSRLAGNSIALIRRRTRGEYIRNQDIINPSVPLDTRYTQNETELQTTRVFSRSSLLGRLTWTERHHDQLPQLDSSGWSGELTYTWNVTEKLTLVPSLAQNYVPYFDIATTHRIDKIASAAAKWQPTGAIGVGLAVSGMHSEFTSAQSLVAVAERRDDYAVIDGSIIWTPIRWLSLNAGVQRQKRTSNDPAFPYAGTITRLGASLTF